MCLRGKITTKYIPQKDAINGYKVFSVKGRGTLNSVWRNFDFHNGLNKTTSPGFHAFKTRQGAERMRYGEEIIKKVKLFGRVRFGKQHQLNRDYSSMSATRIIIED